MIAIIIIIIIIQIQDMLNVKLIIIPVVTGAI